MREEHLSPEEVGRMAHRAGVTLVVLSHIGPALDNETDMRIYSEGVRKYFTGTVVAAQDGMEF
jgi:ribonuclease BN (tRNA processing enzyme)